MPTLTELASHDGGGAVLRADVRQAQAAPGLSDRPFAILRYAKLRSSGSIRGSAAHMRRAIPTPNADPAATPRNEVLVGTSDPAADVLRLVPQEGARDMSGKLRRRANSVLAVEVMLTTSPAWWETATAEQQGEWVARSRAWLELEWGAANVAHLELHRDETTIHLTGLIVPLDDSGHLNARAWIGGRSARSEPGSSLLSGHQTRYAEVVEPLGLRRGLLGSTARHTTLREHYRRVEAVQEAHGPDLGTPPLLGRHRWAQEAAETVEAHTATLAAKAAELPVERQRRLAAERTAENSSKALQEAQAARKAAADELRALPLGDVLAALGLEEDAKERGLWKAGPQGARTHRIAVKGAKWFDHVADRGRGGAIDLAQHVLETDFNGALAWLGHHFGTAATAADYRGKLHAAAERLVERVVEERGPFVLPQSDPEAWPQVRRHLVEERAIPADLVDAAHEAGDVYAVSRPGRGGTRLRNAVFVQRDMSGQPTGAELKGTVRTADGSHWSGLAPGSKKGAGAFRVGVELAKTAAVFVVESAIDALSLAARIRDRIGSFAILSTAGDGHLPEGALEAIAPQATRYAAQDRNLAGDRQAERLGEGWKRARPRVPFEDWNEELVARARAGSGDQAGHVTPQDRDASDPSPAP